ncbi:MULTISPECIES: hypothetical protein [unclassified Rhizobium]|nr:MULTISPECIES: hypothetical protein [unclassified Rhizobium]MDM9619193.1 hypothetical protein [Rhizobium sp. S96]
MAKGQIRGNREVRKPKKDKASAKTAPHLGAQVRHAAGFAPAGKVAK